MKNKTAYQKMLEIKQRKKKHRYRNKDSKTIAKETIEARNGFNQYTNSELMNEYNDMKEKEIKRLNEECKNKKMIIEQIEDILNPLPFETDFDLAIKNAELKGAKKFADKLKEIIIQENEIYIRCAKNLLSEDFQRGYEEKNDVIIGYIDLLLNNDFIYKE